MKVLVALMLAVFAVGVLAGCKAEVDSTQSVVAPAR